MISPEMANTALLTEAPPGRRTYTLTHALAIRAYGEDVASRYARPGADYPGETFEHEAKVAAALRERELRYPTTSRLPGADSLLDLESQAHLQAELTRWEGADLALWNQAQASLLQDLVAGRWYALNQTGRISVEFWQDTDLGDPRVKWWCYRPTPLDAASGVVRSEDRADNDDSSTDSKLLLPPFTYSGAIKVLAGMKSGGVLLSRPILKDAIQITLRNFATAPRDPVRRALVQLWGQGKRGPASKCRRGGPRNETSSGP